MNSSMHNERLVSNATRGTKHDIEVYSASLRSNFWILLVRSDVSITIRASIKLRIKSLD